MFIRQKTYVFLWITKAVGLLRLSKVDWLGTRATFYDAIRSKFYIDSAVFVSLKFIWSVEPFFLSDYSIGQLLLVERSSNAVNSPFHTYTQLYTDGYRCIQLFSEGQLVCPFAQSHSLKVRSLFKLLYIENI
jgi:hypothetical protein